MALLSDLLLGAGLKAWLTVILPVSFIVYFAFWIVYARTLHPLAKIPGPFWPSVSRTWLMYRMYVGDLEQHQRALHDLYGPIIRVAPDEVAVSDPEAIPRIYPITKPLEKTNWYHAWRPPGLNCQPDLFTETNERAHSAYRRIVGGVYALSSILKSEAELDKTLNLFMRRIDGFVDRNEAFDFGLWLEMYAFDNIGAVFFGQEFGFMEHSHDHGNYIHAVHLAMPFLSIVTMAPVYIRPFLLVAATTIPKLLKAVLAVDGIRVTAVKETAKGKARSEEATSKRHDILSQLLALVQEKGDKVNFTHNEITSEMWTGVMAGADSTSIALRAIFYFLMKHPEKLAKVRAEVDAAFADGRLSHPVQYNAAITLPYLHAVVKEATRIFPSFQVTMPRYAPAQGLELCGTHIPAGYRVGMNPFVVQRNQHPFGKDADEFRPERWLESDERTRAMDKATISFGAGTRQCTGKNLAMTEIYKVTAEILRRFEFEMAHDRPWTTQNATFCVQTGVICKFKRRDLF